MWPSRAAGAHVRPLFTSQLACSNAAAGAFIRATLNWTRRHSSNSESQCVHETERSPPEPTPRGGGHLSLRWPTAAVSHATAAAAGGYEVV